MDPPTPVSHEIWAVASERYRSSDSELLSSGLLADAEVHCMQTKRVWKVHKAILCSRSEWFKKALAGGNWKEQETGVVEIHDTPESHIDLILTFLYEGHVDLRRFFGEQQPLWISCMEVWKLADFFCLNDLCQRALRLRDNVALHWAKTYAYHVGQETLQDFPPELVDEMVKSISALYRNERVDFAFRSTFKTNLIATAISGVILLAQNASFTSLFHDIPDFAVDWALKLTSEVGATPPYDCDEYPMSQTKCFVCGIHQRESSGDESSGDENSGDENSGDENSGHVDSDSAGAAVYINPFTWVPNRWYDKACESCFPVPSEKTLRTGTPEWNSVD